MKNLIHLKEVGITKPQIVKEYSFIRNVYFYNKQNNNSKMEYF